MGGGGGAGGMIWDVYRETRCLCVPVYVCMYVCTHNIVEGNTNICDELSLSSCSVIIELESFSRWTLVDGGLSSPGQHWDV